MKRILVVMPNWFGEALFVTPLLRGLSDGLPQAAITGLGVARAREALVNNSCLDRWIDLDDAAGPLAALRLAARLRAECFDAALIPRRSLSRTAVLALAGIPRRIGFANAKSGWLLSDAVPPPEARTHKARGYLRLLPALGLPPLDDARARFEYVSTAQERQDAQRLLHEQGLPDGTPMVVLHPGANWPHKRWPAERFAQLVDRLMTIRPLSVLLTGTEDDRPLIDAILAKTMATPFVLAGRTTFRQFAACLERAQLVVTNDTGPVHLAAALGRPVVGLFGPTDPALTGPLGDPALTTVIHHADSCPTIPCAQPNHPGRPGMAAISVDEVFEAARRFLKPGA